MPTPHRADNTLQQHQCVNGPSSSAASLSAERAIPYANPIWYDHRFQTPQEYYNQSHHALRDRVRRFVDTEILPHVDKWEEQKTYPRELHHKAYQAGIYAAAWPKQYGGTPLPGCHQEEEADPFHILILADELARCAAGGVLAACMGSFGIALPPILKYGSQFLIDKVARLAITGQKIMCLCVTEPGAGSDVANISTTAEKRGSVYIVNGTKKFITAGCKADFFTVAVRTGGNGISGISLLLLQRGMPGLSTRSMDTQGWWSSNTAFVTMEDVEVPIENLIGEENQGFIMIMTNFNRERFSLAVNSNRFARVCMSEAIRYGRLRHTFGSRLMDKQVIRHKVAEMAMRIEATHHMLEWVAYQLKCKVPDRLIAGPMSLIKVQATRTMEYCAREASQIFGGASYLRSGPGAKVERLYREVRVNSIGGGSEEIMMDLAMRMAKL